MKRAFVLAVLLALAAHVIRAQQAGSNVNVLPVFTDAADLDQALVKGDLYLQRQVEPVVAVSTRNPDHVFAAFNDYRAVDFVEADNGLGESEAGSEAWIGLAQSTTSGSTWFGSLLPGSPVDHSPESLSSPVYGMAAATDASLYAAPCGQFYLTFLAFDRGGRSQLAVARFEDLNNREDAHGAIVYRGMSVVATGSASGNGRFIDKPALIVDPARPGSSADPCGHTVYVSYTTFTGPEMVPPGQAKKGNTEEHFRSQINVGAVDRPRPELDHDQGQRALHAQPGNRARGGSPSGHADFDGRRHALRGLAVLRSPDDAPGLVDRLRPAVLEPDRRHGLVQRVSLRPAQHSAHDVARGRRHRVQKQCVSNRNRRR